MPQKSQLLLLDEVTGYNNDKWDMRLSTYLVKDPAVDHLHMVDKKNGSMVIS